MRCFFQIVTEGKIKSVKTSEINDAGASLMRCCSQIEIESEIELVEMSKINDARSSLMGLNILLYYNSYNLSL